ncbi:MAG: TldD/PmbA family protein [Nanoarchaeota archaeon]
MAEGRIEVEDLDIIKPIALEVIANSQRINPGLRYADLRIRVDDGPSVQVENGNVRGAQRDFDCCFGIRVIAEDGSVGLGYFGGRLGAQAFHSLDARSALEAGINEAYQRAMVNGKAKSARQGLYGPFGESLIDTALAPTEIHSDIVKADYVQDPRSIDLTALAGRGIQASQAMTNVDPVRMQKALVVLQALMARELFISTEGASLDEAYAKAEAFVLATARNGDDVPETLYEALGNMHGLEVFDGRNMFNQTLESFAAGLADETARLSAAPMLQGRYENVKVVTDGDFNCLWVHENVGHPSEADRCLGMETGYAGRSWFFRNGRNNQIGQQIASPLLTVYTTSDLDAYGRYSYDAEGVRTRKVVHIDQGTFRGFLHSRWSAHVMQQMGIEGQEPDGSMRATNANNVPYIRMRQTGIEAGESDPAEIIAQVEDGWLLAGKRIPSMSESRENFQISPRRTYRIENGKVGQMFRGGALTGDAQPYMQSIWAVGKDVGLYNVPNCGKAVPMQVMYLCNQAPTMGAVGTVIGESK